MRAIPNAKLTRRQNIQLAPADGRFALLGWRKALREGGPPVLVLAVLATLWLILTYVVLDPSQRFLLPSPQEVVKVGLLEPRNLSEILNGLLATTTVAMTGLAIAITLGVGLAILMNQAKSIERSFYP